jgi:hypothetical protein
MNGDFGLQPFVRCMNWSEFFHYLYFAIEFRVFHTDVSLLERV